MGSISGALFHKQQTVILSTAFSLPTGVTYPAATDTSYTASLARQSYDV